MNQRHELLDRIEALKHRNRALEQHSREEIHALQQQLEAVLGRSAGTQPDARKPHLVLAQVSSMNTSRRGSIRS